MPKDNGGKALPSGPPVFMSGEGFVGGEPGMSMRQYYKAAAMVGIVQLAISKNVDPMKPEDCAKWAASIADEMITEDREAEK